MYAMSVFAVWLNGVLLDYAFWQALARWGELRPEINLLAPHVSPFQVVKNHTALANGQ